jgi:non-specific serine/threonine protein kinase
MIEDLGRYKILEEIGRGGFAIVYRTQDTELDRLVALKELRPALLHDTEWVKGFKREARTIARLNHPRIVTIHDVIEVAERLFIVMHLVDGPSLDNLIAAQGRLPWSQAVEIITALAEALDYAHAQGILHRDLKPANILLDSKRGPLLSDFGLAKLVSEASTNVTAGGGIVGTPHYIAPEVWEGQGTTPQSEVYALGCILHEMLTGEKLFQGESPPAVMMAHFSSLMLPQTWPEGVPSHVVTVLEKALAKQPHDRYTMAGELAAVLSRLTAVELKAAPDADIPTRVATKAEEALPISAVRSMPTQPRVAHNLPVQTTSFIGRASELADIKRLLLEEPNCRLLNLAGPGGIGKTRLALATAAQLLETFPDGTSFVSLAPVGEIDDIVPAIAAALRFSFYGRTDPKDQLLDYLSQKQLLLVVDNFEHLLDGADLLSDILSQAPEVTLLATSRERLHLQEEWVYEVPGLAFPAGGGQTSEGADAMSPPESSEVLTSYSAVELFTQRARQITASFAPSTDEMADIGRICQLVEGMPLGLELAAPWIRTLSCREIAAEIERSLDFLTTSLRNMPERHRSLRVVFEQTWGRLSDGEHAVLQQLSVFRGGCTREAAEQVTGATLPVLSSLVDKALLRRTNLGRYELHELIRQFAEAQLQTEPAAVEQAQQRHRDYFIAFLEARTAGVRGHG